MLAIGGSKRGHADLMFGRDAINLLVTDLKSTLNNVVPGANVGPGWPTLETLQQQVAQNAQVIVSVYDRGASRDSSRFMLYTASEFNTVAGVTTSLSSTQLAPLGSVVITIGGSPVADDAVSFVTQNGRTVSAAVTAPASAGETTTQIAAALAVAINIQAPLNTWVSASATGSQVTVTNLGSANLSVSTYAGNIGTRYVEEDRKIRDIQVDVWAPTDAARTATGKLIDTRLAYLDAHFGLQGVGPPTDDGTWVRVRDMGDRFIDGDVLKDVYRWMWLVTLEYGQTYAEQLYSVLVFEPTFKVTTPNGTVTLG